VEPAEDEAGDDEDAAGAGVLPPDEDPEDPAEEVSEPDVFSVLAPLSAFWAEDAAGLLLDELLRLSLR
jgi:hypothetical protein